MVTVDVATVRVTPRVAVAPAVRFLARMERLDGSPPAADARRMDWRAVALLVGFVVAVTAVARRWRCLRRTPVCAWRPPGAAPLADDCGAAVKPIGHAAQVLRGALLMFVLMASTLAVVPQAKAVTVGIADQRASTFEDPRLTDLPVAHTRLSVAWDALRYGWQRQEIDDWMRGAKAAGLRPLVVFGRSRTRKYSLPRTEVFARQVRDFRRRYPHVREYSPWNEPNVAIRKENYDPRRIASYYHVLRRSCPSCRVLGADVVDTSSLARWMRAYLREFAPGRRPMLWGLHNYVDVNSSSSWGTQTMRRLAPGEIWFTETGAIVRRTAPVGPPDRRMTIRIGGARALEATKRVFRLARTSPRITRVYIYHWKASREGSWDSALVAPNGALRPSFDVFAQQARLSPQEPYRAANP